MDEPAKTRTAALSIGALGVVFGDIGTSPLYTFSAALHIFSLGGAHDAIGLASVIVWTLTLIVSIKYVQFVLRADFEGEGGVFALMNRIRRAMKQGWARKVMPIPLIFGAGLLLGDGTITPAISVLSAVEGLESINPHFKELVLPVTVGILIALFAIQRAGTGHIGSVFGYLMLVWFGALAASGGQALIQEPTALRALNPLEGIGFIIRHGPGVVILFGAVVLAVTGAEALYADLGHFGRKPITLAWFGVVFPSLVLNYLGQAAFVLRFPDAASDPNLFFLLVDSGFLRIGFVILATVATVIASQALISGSFSLVKQAMDLDLCPRFLVVHTSSRERGQIFIPSVNLLLGVVCILLVLIFRSSVNLAAAYGLAVSLTMVITTVMFGVFMVVVWRRRVWEAVVFCALVLAVEVPMATGCLMKLFEGAFVPLVMGIILFGVMRTWSKARNLMHLGMLRGVSSSVELVDNLAENPVARVPGVIVFSTRDQSGREAAATAAEYVRRTQALPHQVVLLALHTSWKHSEGQSRRVRVKRVGDGIIKASVVYGFREEPDLPTALRLIEEKLAESIVPDQEDKVFYVLTHRVVAEHVGRSLRPWQRVLVSFLSRNERPSKNYYSIPPERIIDFTWHVRV